MCSLIPAKEVQNDSEADYLPKGLHPEGSQEPEDLGAEPEDLVPNTEKIFWTVLLPHRGHSILFDEEEDCKNFSKSSPHSPH